MKGENLLICDLAETYGIYDYKTLPPSQVAIFCMGLRPDSRVMLSLNGESFSSTTLLLASIRDYLSLIWWSKTEDGSKNKNRPELISQHLMANKTTTNNDNNKDLISFNSSKDFERKRKEILGGTNGD